MGRLTLLLLTGTVLLALFIARIPASVVSALLPATVTASGVTGSLWRGSASHVDVSQRGQVFALGRVNWVLNPRGLLWGDVLTLESRWGDQRGDLALDFRLGGTTHLNDVMLSLDLGWVRNLIPLYVAGRLTADMDHLAVDSTGMLLGASGRIVWENAAWRAVGGDVSLGTYVIDIDTTDQGVQGRMSTRKGALEVNGQFAIEQGRYTLAADLSGPAARNEAFQQAIALLAVPVGSGYRIELSGTL